jgi:hypothetical protein
VQVNGEADPEQLAATLDPLSTLKLTIPEGAAPEPVYESVALSVTLELGYVAVNEATASPGVCAATISDVEPEAPET